MGLEPLLVASPESRPSTDLSVAGRRRSEPLQRGPCSELSALHTKIFLGV